MRYRTGFCSVCSVEKEDIRDLRIDEDMITCTVCGTIHLKEKDGMYYYLRRLERGRI